MKLLRFAERHTDAGVWAVEDCRHVSGGLERFLLRAGETVIPVPPKLMANARRGARTFAKSDSIDALASRRRGCASPSCRKHG